MAATLLKGPTNLFYGPVTVHVHTCEKNISYSAWLFIKNESQSVWLAKEGYHLSIGLRISNKQRGEYLVLVSDFRMSKLR